MCTRDGGDGGGGVGGGGGGSGGAGPVATAQAMAALGLKDSVAPRPLPGFVTRYDVYKVMTPASASASAAAAAAATVCCRRRGLPAEAQARTC